MMGYASRTRTRRNVEALAAAGWGWMVGPLDCGGPILRGMPHALDNGAWPAFAQGKAWDEDAFLRALRLHGPTAQFIVVPDVVADRTASLRRTLDWLPRLLAREDLKAVRLLLAVQDGMRFDDLASHVGGRVGIFIGGSTDWKIAAIDPWGRWAAELGIYCHVGRVNTVRRILLCAGAAVDSFDGTSATRFAKSLPPLAWAAKRGGDLFTPNKVLQPVEHAA